jgi:membrane-associated protein
MGNVARRPVRRLLLWILVLSLLGTAAGTVLADGPAPDGAAPAAIDDDGLLGYFQRILSNLFNSGELVRILGDKRFEAAAIVALNLIIFTETGLLVGFFLPGDSLLVSAGLVCSISGWSLPLLLVTLCVAAVVGDSVGYAIGYNTGPKIFSREQSIFFHKDHLLKAQRFYEDHGGKTIVLARFMPILRTFAPVVAGVGRMQYSSFLFFNVFGGVGWVTSMVLIGYFLRDAINPVLAPIFGEGFDVQHHIEKVIIVVVLLSISPGIVVWVRNKLRGTPHEEPALAGGVRRH